MTLTWGDITKWFKPIFYDLALLIFSLFIWGSFIYALYTAMRK